MAIAKFEWQEHDDDATWDQWVAASPQGTVFSQSSFLRSLGCPFKRYIFLAENRPVALCCATESPSGEQLLACDFTPYQGLLFLTDAGALSRQRLLDEFRITEFVIEVLTQRYQAIAVSLSCHFGDLRPFLWHNYHARERGQFIASPRYTPILDLTTSLADNFALQARSCRRQELRKAAAYYVQEDFHIDHFIDLYALTFARQGILLGADKLSLVRRITSAALEHGYGRLSACSTSQGLASMMLLLFDASRAYYLFAANHPGFRNSGAATRLMFDNIQYAQQRQLKEFDFVGANSPNRGDFKLSFNPELKLYFDLRYERGAGIVP